MSPYAKVNAILLSLAAAWAGACEPRELPDAPSPARPEVTNVKPLVETKSYSLPAALRVEDNSVSEFVEHAMDAVASGEYESFRLLWSVKDEPVSRFDYEQRWGELTGTRVRELRRIILTDADETPTGIDTYALLVDFSHEPPAGSRQREPLRDVVWLVVKEQDQWRLAKSPKKVKLWIRREAGDAP